MGATAQTVPRDWTVLEIDMSMDEIVIEESSCVMEVPGRWKDLKRIKSGPFEALFTASLIGIKAFEITI